MQSAAADPQASRRRPRHDSSSSSSSSLPAPLGAAASPGKRPKYSAETMMSAASSTMSARAKGKLPEAAGPSRSSASAFQPYTGAKKLQIKNLRTSTSADRDAKAAEYYARIHRDLEAAVEAVWAGGKLPLPLERLYRGVEDLCRKGDAGKIYDPLRTRMEAHVNKVILPRVERNGRNSNMETAKSLLAEWHAWNSQMILVRSTFSFLDRTYLLRDNHSSINDLAILYFRRMAFPSQDVAYSYSTGRKLLVAMCELIENDRRGKAFDALLLKGSLRMLYVLGVYERRFEPMFLEESRSFFREFAASHSTSGLKGYIQACEKLLQKEHYRCLEFNIDSATERQLMDSAHDTLIDDYTDKLLDVESLGKLLASKDVESMKGLYDLLCLSKIQKKLREPWAQYIGAACSGIISDKEHGDTMVFRLLALRRSLDLMVRDAFGKDEDFTRATREALGKAMNDSKTASCWSSGTSKVGEMIAKHIDMLLRGGLKSLDPSLLSDVKDRAAAEKEGQSSTADEDAELDRQLDQALELFRFVEGKDTFEAFYKKDLARRLLMGRSASQDAERSMLAKLRGECGASFTHNLEKMFKDQELGKEEMQAYKALCDKNADDQSSVDLHVMVLSMSAWPSYPDVPLHLPDVVATQQERFENFYKAKHSGRILKWKHSLAHCTLKAKFARGPKELMVSAYQASVLLLFNPVPSDGFLAYEQISKGTGLQGADLDRTLQSLACGKFRVLTKHPKGRDVDPTDTFTFNKTFWDPKFRVKINQIQHKETKEENKAIHERVVQDRGLETQAAIVRIMKSRKKMTHPELQAEVINMTKNRGSVEPPAIKKEIERYASFKVHLLAWNYANQPGPCSLIDREYLERADNNSYVYVA
ncbi:Cullin-4A-like protein [Hapsidospora chrysogenum ATCC 11550]|uniref:Cullin-4A-like protein n=1 Tax=Hapsidospora chrysogenum (strain ATCC 11550 / CBS 779.69 / DSM 880 / IAM 14645 / JCM 23072 / IMI 49137) TaxID=857340 RepID=A0A086T1J3_HAPC1|nr:Cullin-4A-like protein [Hapsidospora chrysogenum ATCC 11550]